MGFVIDLPNWAIEAAASLGAQESTVDRQSRATEQ